MFAYYVSLNFCPLPIFFKGWILGQIGKGKLETQTISCETPSLDHNLKMYKGKAVDIQNKTS